MKQQLVDKILFYSCNPSDYELCEQLVRALRQLVREAHLSEWLAQQVPAGFEVAQERKSALEKAALILILLSAEYLASDLCYQEMREALERQQRGEIQVVPILLRPCDWETTSSLASLRPLPKNGQAVTSWDNQDAAFRDIARGLRQTLDLPHTRAYPQSTREQKNRAWLIKRVRKNWIEGVFAPSLHEVTRLTLCLQERPDVLAHPGISQMREFSRPPQSLPVGTSIMQVYEQSDGELLILGEPGAGKTTLLLELTRALLEQAEQDETYPIPVIFPLSSWAARRQPFTEWLAQELHTHYQVPIRTAVSWIETDHVLPLLDGLDEVAAPHQAACVESINVYRREHGFLPTVVSSRQADYLALSARFMLRAAVVIHPLTSNQIEASLMGSDEGLKLLHQILHEDADLRTLASTPLMLNVLTTVYRGTTPQDLLVVGSLDMKQKQVFASYVQRMLRRRASRYASAEQTQSWLTFLAARMRQFQQTTFYLDNIEARWLGNRLGPFLQIVSLGLIVCLPGSLILGHFSNLAVGLSFGLVLALSLWWMDASRSPKSEQQLIQDRVIQQTLSTWQRLFLTLGCGLGCGIVGGLIVGFISILIAGFSKGLVSGLVNVLIFGLEGILFCGIAAGIAARDRPDYGPIDYSAAAWFGSLSVPIFGLVVGLTCWLMAVPIVGLICGLFIEMFYVASFISRFTLRFWFWCTGTFSWKRASFLDETVDHLLMYKVGRGYIFIHRLLLDYFANLESAPISTETVEREQETTSSIGEVADTLTSPLVFKALAELPISPLSDGSRLLPCGHEQHPKAHFCSVCGTPVPS